MSRLAVAALLAALALSACGVKGDPVRPPPAQEPVESAESAS